MIFCGICSINARFYTALVLVAVITSQFAGAWLEYVLRKNEPDQTVMIYGNF